MAEKRTDRQRRYREPEPGTRAAESLRILREAGFDARMPDFEEGEHRLIFFGSPPSNAAEPEDERK